MAFAEYFVHSHNVKFYTYDLMASLEEGSYELPPSDGSNSSLGVCSTASGKIDCRPDVDGID